MLSQQARMHQTGVAVTIFVACLALVGSQSSNCMENLFERVMKCFETQGLTLNVQPGQQDANRLMKETQVMDPAVQCQKKELYKNAVTCGFTAMRNCLSGLNMDGAIPNANLYRQGIDVVCRRVKEFDGACLTMEYTNITTCGEDTVKNLVTNTEDSPSMEDIICLTSDVYYDCASKYLKNCGNQTMDIYLEQLDKYQVPQACIKRNPGRSNRRNYLTSGTSGMLGTSNNSVNIFPTYMAGVISLLLYALHTE